MRLTQLGRQASTSYRPFVPTMVTETDASEPSLDDMTDASKLVMVTALLMRFENAMGLISDVASWANVMVSAQLVESE